VSNTVAARAALTAYAAARQAGAAPQLALDVALARYRSFFPLASAHRIRGILADAQAVERARDRASAACLRKTLTQLPDGHDPRANVCAIVGPASVRW
jgi:hypothetical protein